MAILQAKVTLQRTNMVPADAVVNTWYFSTTEPLPPTLPLLIAQRLWTEVYNSGASPNRLIDHLSPLINQTQHRVDMFNLSLPPPRVPVATALVAFVIAPGGTALPAEVALCLSYKAEVLSGDNPRRRRGRAYMGPLNTIGMLTTGQAVRPSAGLQTTLQACGQRLLNASDAEPDWTWTVYSRVGTGSPAVPVPMVNPVVEGWVDNAYDTQRRRGVDATARVTFS